MFLFSLAKTDARVAGEFASDGNGDLQRFIAAKQWKKVEHASSKLTRTINANKRPADGPEEWQKKRKRLVSKK